MHAILYFFAIVLLTYFVLHKLLTLSHDPKEPPQVPSRIPIFGHVFGMLREGSAYYTKITKRCKLPIYTLPLPNSKAYVVTTPSLVSMIDRHSKTVSFAPHVVEFTRRLLLASPEGVDAVNEDLLCERPVPGLREQTLRAMHATLATGHGLESTTREAVSSLNKHLGFVEIDSGHQETQLFAWVRKVVTLASTDAIYGSQHNPFHAQKVQDGFWDIDDGFSYLMLNILPDVMAPKASQGRRTFFEALNQYYARNGQVEASEVIKARYKVNCDHGMSLDDIARFDLAVSFGLLANTVPGASWALYYVFSSPALLEEARNKVFEALATETDKRESEGYVSVNIANIVASCPLLTSIVRETLRVQSTNAATRIVLKDTKLEDQYLLKKDALVFIPSADIHRNETVWGPGAMDFDPYRFLNLDTGKSSHKVPASAHRTFGTGASVCPGRFLAINEILAIMIIVLLRYDVRPTSATWTTPPSIPHISRSILIPGGDIAVTISEREESKGSKWHFFWDAEANLERKEQPLL